MRRRILSLTIIFVVLFVFYEVSNAEPINGKVRNVNKMNDWSVRVGLAGIKKEDEDHARITPHPGLQKRKIEARANSGHRTTESMRLKMARHFQRMIRGVR